MEYTANGQCPTDVPEPITNCERSSKTGSAVYVDFHEINRPCSCAVSSLFTGDLLVTVKPSSYFCYDEATVTLGSEKIVFECDVATSTIFKVQANDTFVNIRGDYIAGYASKEFHVCIGFGQNGGQGGIVNVTCGNSTGTTATTTVIKATTTTTKTTTAIATSSTTTPTTKTPTKTSTSKSELRSTTSSTVLSAESKLPGINIEETDTTIRTHNITTVVYSFLQKSTSVSSNNVTYIAGAAAGGLVLVLVLVVLVVIIVLRQKRIRKGDKTKKTDDASKHTNRAFDENYGLPDNPLYHSAQPMDEIGYSSVQKNRLGLPSTEATNDPNYDITTNNKSINDSDTSPMPMYAVPNKSGASPPEENEPQAMYAQVLKPSKSTTQDPMQSANQNGLVYLEVEKDAISVNENTPYTQNENKDSVLYAGIKRN